MVSAIDEEQRYTNVENGLEFSHSPNGLRTCPKTCDDFPTLRSDAECEDVAQELLECAPNKHETTASHSLYSSSESSVFEQHSQIPRYWPLSPRPTESSTGVVIWNILVDITLLALSMVFLIFALSVISYDQRPTANDLQTKSIFAQASKWSPTIFPILFASVLGRASHSFLLWRLEKGERIGTLDTLAGSTSLTNTVVSQFHMRVISYVGFALITLWVLSPIGGQASFRHITFGPKGSAETANFRYIVPDGDVPWYLDDLQSLVSAVYIAALNSPATREGHPCDAWGHIKVPRIEDYEEISVPDNDGWYATHSVSAETYSSFVGIPIRGTESPDYVNYKTKIETMYFHLTCDSHVQSGSLAGNVKEWLGGTVEWSENTTKRAEIDAENLQHFNFVLRGEVSNKTSSGPWSCPWSCPEPSPFAFNCTIETTYVEIEVTCPTSATCSASRIRRSRIEHPPAAHTQLDLPLDADETYEDTYWDYMMTANFGLHSSLFLISPWNLTVTNDRQREQVAPSAEECSTRVSQMLNAHWMVMNGKDTIGGVFDDDTTWLDAVSWPYQRGGAGHYLSARTWQSEGTKVSNTEVFQAHFGWSWALIISSSVLIIASLVPFYIRTFLLRGPDILMNLSSLATRDNPYIGLPPSGTYLDAADRSRILKDMKIRFGDVEEGGEVGRLAIGRLVSGIGASKKGRIYV